jgi:hypothetical protein
MNKRSPIEIFMPPNMLKAKVGGTLVGLDTSAVKRAEKALESLKTEFHDWIASDVLKLAECCEGFAADPVAGKLDELCRTALDLKSQAGSFGFPLVERIAGSLCRLLNEGNASAALPLIEAHIAAIRVIVRDQITDRDNLVATTLARELETRVGDFLSRSRPRT